MRCKDSVFYPITFNKSVFFEDFYKKGFIKTGDIPHELKLKDGTYLDGETMVLFLNK